MQDQQRSDRRTSASTEGETRRSTSRLAAIAIGALAVLVTGFFVVRSQVSQDPAIELIDEYGEAFFTGDHETALDILGWDPENSLGFINWSEYEAAIGAETSVECELRAESDGVYDCLVYYSNSLFEAVDEPPVAKPWQGRVQGELIEVRSYDNSNQVEDSWIVWLQETGSAASSECQINTAPTADCARFQLANLDEWADWYLETYE